MKKSGTATRRTGTVRCAIYTRKSSEEGLEQEFNSLQAQREACERSRTSDPAWTRLERGGNRHGRPNTTAPHPDSTEPPRSEGEEGKVWNRDAKTASGPAAA